MDSAAVFIVAFNYAFWCVPVMWRIGWMIYQTIPRQFGWWLRNAKNMIVIYAWMLSKFLNIICKNQIASLRSVTLLRATTKNLPIFCNSIWIMTKQRNVYAIWHCSTKPTWNIKISSQLATWGNLSLNLVKYEQSWFFFSFQ